MQFQIVVLFPLQNRTKQFRRCRHVTQCHISYEAQASGPLQSRGPQHENRHSIQFQLAFTLWLLPNIQCNQWRIQGGVWGNYPPKPLWRPFLVPTEVERDLKILLNNIFCVVKRQGLCAGLYPTSYRIAWTMLLFRNNYTVSFFLCHVRTAQLSQTQSRSQFSTCYCAVWKWSVFLQVYSFMPDDRLERKKKDSSKNRNAMWKTYYWLKIYKPPKWKRKPSFRAIASAVRECAVCLHRIVLQHKSEWIDFLTELIFKLTGAWRGELAPGARCKFGAPVFEPEVFRKQMYVYWRMYVWHCWDILAPPEWFGAQVIAPPCPFVTSLLTEP